MIEIKIVSVRGPPGSGKTLIAKSIAETLWRQDKYSDFHHVSSLEEIEAVVGDPRFRKVDDIFVVEDSCLPWEKGNSTKFWKRLVEWKKLLNSKKGINRILMTGSNKKIDPIPAWEFLWFQTFLDSRSTHIKEIITTDWGLNL